MEQKTKLHAVKDLPANGEGVNGTDKDSANGTGNSDRREGTDEQEIQQNGDEEVCNPLPSAGAPTLKHPIFIACLEPEIVKQVENFLFEKPTVLLPEEVETVSVGEQDVDLKTGGEYVPLLNKNEYVLLVVEPAVYRQLYQQYMFTQLSEEEQERKNRVMQSTEMRNTALMSAMQLEERIKWYEKNMYHPTSIRKFRENGFCFSDLKTIMTKTQHIFGEKKRITQQVVWNSMDLLVVFEYLVITPETENLTKEKKRYKLFINGEHKLDFFRSILSTKREIIDLKTQELAALENRIVELQAAVEASKSEENQQHENTDQSASDEANRNGFENECDGVVGD